MAIVLGLERITALLERLGNPQRGLRVVHVAGTNGKGSVCACVASILRAAGVRVGSFNSPYLLEPRDSVRVDCEPVAAAAFERATEQVAAADAALGIGATAFEQQTAAALVLLREARVEVAVMEVGLGGRHDATNVIDAPEVAVVTAIGLDHTEYLGTTVEAIAAHKAGIIKAGSAVVIGPQEDAAATRVIEEHARAAGCAWVAPSLKSSKQKHKLLSEIKIHRSLSHPCIVKFYHVFEDDVNVYMILELCENKTFVEMLKKRKRLSDPEIRYYMHQLFDSIRYMHRHGVIHRDIKLGNLFLSDRMHLKIGDFGLAAVIKHDGERKKTICGTPNYIAPEVLFNKEGHSFEVDVWSLGVVMYTLAVGKPPFQTKDVNSIYERIRENNLEFPAAVPVSSEIRTIIKSLLNSNPEQRPSIDDVLEHPFFAYQPMPAQIPVSALSATPKFDASNLIPAPGLASSSGSYSSGSSSGLAVPDVREGAYGGMAGSASAPLGGGAYQAEAISSQTPQQHFSRQDPYAAPTRHGPELRHYDPVRIPGAIRANGHAIALSPESAKPPGPPSGQTSPVNARELWARQHDAPDAGRQDYPQDTSPEPAAGPAVPQYDRNASQRAHQQPQQRQNQAESLDHQAARQPSQETAQPGARRGALEPQRRPSPQNQPPEPALPPTASPAANANGSSPRRGFVLLEELLRTLDTGIQKRINNPTSGVDEINEGIAQFGLEELQLDHPDMFVTKWIDYSNKYGLGYQLRDGSVGVYFNDLTTIILAADNHHFEYLHYNRNGSRTVMHRDAYTFDNFPESLNKKVTLLRHFRGYMRENLFRTFASNPDTAPRIESLDYLTKYLRTREGVFFRLSNNTLQLNLLDHTKLIVSGQGRYLTYIDSNREMQTQTLAWFLSQGPDEVIERLMYIRDVIHQMLARRSQRAAGAGV
ncbi:Cell cycle serine/threonine-protein kinase cdc5/MSD2 [Polyrhizophydium stewartii]|uniref:Cell cycle serine/threonine-protein kinase cdc5/MSD2 n=1 Tax=Polyrhizophydium stewartii TaxID=2732419 RepID=A0ABR4N848_9FUNG